MQKFKERIIQGTIILVLIVICIGFLIFQKTGLRQQHYLKLEIAELEKHNDSLSQKLKEQEQLIKRLTSDSFYIEYIARTKFGMTKKGEISFQFIKLDK